MRTIKFRGKDLKTGKWVYGDLHTLCDEPHIHTEPTHFPYAGKRSFIDPNTVGQFTGIFDKKGLEIYEGDIVDLDYILFDPWDDNFESLVPMRCFIEYRDFGFIFKKEEDLHYFFNDVKNIKVIGNIHDNPDLLKGGAK